MYFFNDRWWLDDNKRKVHDNIGYLFTNVFSWIASKIQTIEPRICSNVHSRWRLPSRETLEWSQIVSDTVSLHTTLLGDVNRLIQALIYLSLNWEEVSWILESAQEKILVEQVKRTSSNTWNCF